MNHNYDYTFKMRSFYISSRRFPLLSHQIKTSNSSMNDSCNRNKRFIQKLIIIKSVVEIEEGEALTGR